MGSPAPWNTSSPSRSNCRNARWTWWCSTRGIHTSTAVGTMFFQIRGAIAEFEYALMSERTLDGLEAARARDRTGGQKPKLGPRQIKLAQQMYDETGTDGKRRYTVQQIADEFGVTRPTIYRHLTRENA
ncbi:recombinase family protein [Nonomuraea sp. NPDC049480]|uniref:recombinase family protein n=1 Tax=Nonomuraea sp. NPDC049480 TaxID=3364353 RepID=UPI0037B48A23